VITNWSVDNDGAYDYAADTRGYTYGLIVEYDTPRWSVRGAEALMPTVANGIVLDWHVDSSHGHRRLVGLSISRCLVRRTGRAMFSTKPKTWL
jgi:hypothetical protein